MALGDIVPLPMGDDTLWLARLAPPAGRRVTNLNDLTEAPLLTVPDGVLGRRSLLARSLRFVMPFRRAERFSLISVTNRLADVTLYSTPDGVEAVSVPHPHLAILAGGLNPRARAVGEKTIVDRLRPLWRDFVDPLIDVRVRVFDDPDAPPGELAVFLGRGVFVPDRGERQIGRVVVIAGDDGEAVHEPCFPDGTPAGLYRGQTSLVFAGRNELAPATSFALGPDDDAVYRLSWVGAFAGGPPPSVVEVLPPTSPDAFIGRVAIEPAPVPDGYDEAYAVYREGPRPDVTIRIIRDMRESRCLPRPPARGPYLAIIGIVAPDEADRRLTPLDRWWIDLDSEGLLVASALTPVARSVICEGRRVSGYDWRRYQTVAEHGFSLERARIGPSRRPVLVSQTGSLGFLALPRQRQRASFAPTTGLEPTYELDWLDFSGAAEALGAEVARLGDYAAGVGDPVWGAVVPGTEERGTDPAIWTRPPTGNPGLEFDHPFDGLFENGTELVIGPLICRIEGGAR